MSNMERVQEQRVSSDSNSGFVSITLHDSEDDNCPQNPTQESDSLKNERGFGEVPKIDVDEGKNVDEEILLKKEFSTVEVNGIPDVQIPNYESPTSHRENETERATNSSVEERIESSDSTSPRVPVQYLKPSVSSAVFSFIMTAVFVCILWLVVFMIFGYKGHAIAGIFIGLFLVGLLINTCFLKLYFRLRVFLGLSAAIAAAERHSAAMQRQRALQTKIISEKTNEKPPSYAIAIASPPPYNLLQYYRQKKSSSSSINSFSSTASVRRKCHNCPFCKREVKIFGICVSCKNNLSKN